jgi:hypothetical protein
MPPIVANAFATNRFREPAERDTSYRRSLDLEGVAGPEDTVLAGGEAELEKAVGRFAEAGATEFQLCPVGPPAERARTIAFFGELARAMP